VAVTSRHHHRQQQQPQQQCANICSLAAHSPRACQAAGTRHVMQCTHVRQTGCCTPEPPTPHLAPQRLTRAPSSTSTSTAIRWGPMVHSHTSASSGSCTLCCRKAAKRRSQGRASGGNTKRSSSSSSSAGVTPVMVSAARWMRALGLARKGATSSTSASKHHHPREEL
jgi:hypothetical protein